MESGILNLPSKPSWWNKKFSIFLIVLFSLLLHLWSVWQLPVDFDEPVYLKAGSDYADLIRDRDIKGVIQYPENREHPALIKLLYAVPFLLFPQLDNPNTYLYLARSISAIFGILSVFVITKMNIWAGLLFAFHSMTLKYTSQAYLEAIPMFFMILAVYLLIKNGDGKWYFIFSGLSLGVVAASKYPYLIIVPVLIYILFYRQKKSFKDLLFYFGISLITAILLNPSLWINPVSQMLQTSQFHADYSQSAHVQSSGYPWYQPVITLATSVPWHPQVFFFFTSDEFMLLIAVLGLYFEYKKHKWTVLWFGIGLMALLLWPTKWPQYTLMITPVIALIAGHTIQRGIDWIRPRNDYWNYLEEMLPQPPRITWYLTAAFILILAVGKVVYEYQLALGRQGWEQYTVSNSPLISDIINDLTFGTKGNLMLASDRGIGFWEHGVETLWEESAEVFDQNNSPLPSNRVVSAVYDSSKEVVWFGIDRGLAYYENEKLVIIPNEQIGCSVCQINDIILSAEDEVWIATNEGIYFFKDNRWNNFTDQNPGIESEIIHSLFYQKTDAEDKLWIGTIKGLSIFNFEDQSWNNINWAGNFFGWGGVAEIIESPSGDIYTATLGGGINIWDGSQWKFYRNTNTPLKSNTINTIKFNQQGDLWIGIGFPTEPGGYMMRLNNEGVWDSFTSKNSGFAGDEPLAIMFDEADRLWIATNGGGLQSFQKP